MHTALQDQKSGLSLAGGCSSCRAGGEESQRLAGGLPTPCVTKSHFTPFVMWQEIRVDLVPLSGIAFLLIDFMLY